MYFSLCGAIDHAEEEQSREATQGSEAQEAGSKAEEDAHGTQVVLIDGAQLSQGVRQLPCEAGAT